MKDSQSMARTRLNLSVLRDQSKSHDDRDDSLDADRLTFSRREVLGLMGAAAVGTSPAFKTIETALRGSVQLVGNSKRVAFTLAGCERWVIDTRRFGGSPKLKVERHDHFIRLALTDATYPGTNLPADLVCELRRGIGGWRMHLQLGLGGFKCTVPFERWLAGLEPARSNIYLRSRPCQLNATSVLAITGPARAHFSPDWLLRLEGKKIARLSGFGSELASDAITFRVLDPKDSSILRKPKPKRTLISLWRGERRWPFESVRHAQDGWQLTTAADSPFDVVHIEMGENWRRSKQAAFLAEATGNASTLSFLPNHRLRGLGGEPASIPLRQARYAVVFDPAGGEERALLARFSEEPVWLHGDGYSLHIGDSTETEPFEFVRRNGKVRLRCIPALLGVVAPLGNAIVEPMKSTRCTHVELIWGRARRRLRTAESPPSSIAGHEKAVNRAPGITALLQIQSESSGRSPTLDVPEYIVSVLRPKDLLALRFEFVNFTLQAGGGQAPRLVRTDPNQAFVIVHFPPQNIGEQAFFQVADGFPTNESSSEYPLSPGLVQARLAGESRLVFSVPSHITTIPYTLPALLTWNNYDQHVAKTALPPGPKPSGQDIPSPYPPEPTETAIETPYRLILSPLRQFDAQAKVYPGWAHALDAITQDGRTELWHTRLAVKLNNVVQEDLTSYSPMLRAIWATDYNPNSDHYPGHPDQYNPFRLSLDAQDRYQIVELTSDFNINIPGFIPLPYIPVPVDVERFMLSALGAWMNVHGVWNVQELPSNFDVEEWRHRATMGRDHYVRVVYAGYLFPFGHRASLVKITERKFFPRIVVLPDDREVRAIVAYLFQRMYIVVRQPEKTFNAEDYPSANDWSDGHEGRQMPFKSVRITTLVTPDLDDPTKPPSAINAYGQNAFWPSVGGSPFEFHLIGTDWNGQTAEFTAPLIFIDRSIALNEVAMSDVLNSAYKGSPHARRDLAGQKVALAPSSGGTMALAAVRAEDAGSPPPDPSLETAAITFAAAIPPQAVSLVTDQPRFYPTLHKAEAYIPAVKQLTGQDATTVISVAQQFLDHGFDGVNNAGEVFAQLFDPDTNAWNPVTLAFDMANGGPPVTPGVISPNLAIAGLSRLLGPVNGTVNGVVTDLSDIAAGNFDPQSFFGDATGLLGAHLPKLFGAIELTKLLQVVNDVTKDVQTLQQIPQLVPTKLPDALELNYTWKTQKLNDILVFKAALLQLDNSGNITTGPQATLTITAKLHTPLKGGEPTYLIQGELDNFSLDFAVLALPFKSLTFTIQSGKKPSVDANVGEVIFEGPLKFINDLRQFLDQFQDPPYLDVTADHISAGYTLAIPSIGVGVFSLQNIALGAGLTIPYFGDAISLLFNFSSREHPFILTVSIFGGGGYLVIGLGPTGLDSLEASLEFGAEIALDIVVASGNVHAMAGVYYKYDKQSGTTLSGFLDLGGSLSVLGLITVSVEFYLSLTYESAGNKLTGKASLTVEIDIAFFSESVTLGPIRREFAGSDPPGQGAMMAERAGHTLPAACSGGPPWSIACLMSETDWTTYLAAFAA
jgi:hypothetical protein